MPGLRTPWTSQPAQPWPVNPYWLERGLVAFFDLQNGIEWLSGARPTNNTATLKPGPAGVGFDFSGSANVQFAHQARFAITGPLTIFAALTVRALTGYSPVIAKQTGPTTNTPYELRLGGASSTNSVVEMVRANAGLIEMRSAANRVAAGYTGGLGVTRPGADIADATGKVFVRDGMFSFASPSGPGTGLSTDDGSSAVWIGRRSDGVTQLDGQIYRIGLFNQGLNDVDAAFLAGAGLWDFSAPLTRHLKIGSTIAVYQPGTDVLVTGWTGTPDNANKANNINESVADDTSLVMSPQVDGTQGPLTFTWDTAVPAGSFDVRMRGNFFQQYTGQVGQVRVVFLDAGSVVGTGAWKTLTGAFADYTDTVTLSGIATQGRLEVQAI